MLTTLLATLEGHVVSQYPHVQRLAEAASATDPITPFLQYGVLGIVVVGFITGWIVPGPQAKALAAENIRLSGLIEGKLFPMLELHAATMERAAKALEKSADAMDRQAERERESYLRNRDSNDRADREAGQSRTQRELRE